MALKIFFGPERYAELMRRFPNQAEVFSEIWNLELLQAMLLILQARLQADHGIISKKHLNNVSKTQDLVFILLSILLLIFSFACYFIYMFFSSEKQFDVYQMFYIFISLLVVAMLSTIGITAFTMNSELAKRPDKLDSFDFPEIDFILSQVQVDQALKAIAARDAAKQKRQAEVRLARPSSPVVAASAGAAATAFYPEPTPKPLRIHHKKLTVEKVLQDYVAVPRACVDANLTISDTDTAIQFTLALTGGFNQVAIEISPLTDEQWCVGTHHHIRNILPAPFNNIELATHILLFNKETLENIPAEYVNYVRSFIDEKLGTEQADITQHTLELITPTDPLAVRYKSYTHKLRLTGMTFGDVRILGRALCTKKIVLSNSEQMADRVINRIDLSKKALTDYAKRIQIIVFDRVDLHGHKVRK